MSRLSRLEQETIISFNAAEDIANIYSSDPVWIRKIEKIKGHSKIGLGMEVNVSKKWIRLQKPNKLSPEAKAKASARMKAMAKSKSADRKKKAQK